MEKRLSRRNENTILFKGIGPESDASEREAALLDKTTQQVSAGWIRSDHQIIAQFRICPDTTRWLEKGRGMGSPKFAPQGKIRCGKGVCMFLLSRGFILTDGIIGRQRGAENKMHTLVIPAPEGLMNIYRRESQSQILQAISVFGSKGHCSRRPCLSRIRTWLLGL